MDLTSDSRDPGPAPSSNLHVHLLSRYELKIEHIKRQFTDLFTNEPTKPKLILDITFDICAANDHDHLCLQPTLISLEFFQDQVERMEMEGRKIRNTNIPNLRYIHILYKLSFSGSWS
jgi:hypothetical protein